ncbi:MAG: isoleucine--tRNA ligase [Pseudomonadales bacterium]|nr:isoleucine--tRNA ligase [Pseudomonadales bacterium]
MSDAPNKETEPFSFVDSEHEMMRLWQEQQIFQQSLRQTEDCPPYIFYDGPPFATGLPHHGHLVASTIKDIIPRYFTMQGRYVQRRFGWDCHGLPIEHEIDKSLGMSSQEAVDKLGIQAYNNECRGIVQRYTQQWQKTISRLGRWVDFDNDYKTMDPWFMESVWWVLKQLWDKDLVYRGNKVVPFSTALGTVLSNFEAGSNYQDIQDPAITVLFKLSDRNEYLSAWTTTPWTLPSNLALCVGSDITYVKAFDRSNNRSIWLAKERLSKYSEKLEADDGTECLGSELVGLHYEPVFPYFKAEATRGAFKVLADDYVTTDSGTGIVHIAPAFGEDDFRVIKAAGIEAFACPIEMDGTFTLEVNDFAGMHVKEADKAVINKLKEQQQLLQQEVIQHSYPMCPRSDTPIIYRAISSWYIKVEQMRERLNQVNQNINWVPEHIRDGRMGNWLSGAVDWAISRNRYWGTPIPIWINDTSGKSVCIGSREELKSYTGEWVEDLHREHIDHLTFSLPGEEGIYKRVDEVLDCWFESGSMPYAQLHYPFENQNLFSHGYPAEFIAEGLDQTRGWFYTLIVLGTALFDTHAFKNVIVNGIVMAEDGKKMSKRLRNYTPPDQLMETYGADALRLYLINSGLVKAEEQRFSDTGVKDMVRRALLPWYNAFKFLKTYADIDQWKPEVAIKPTANIMDQWILSRLQTLKLRVTTEMENYRLYNVVPPLFEFIEDLTNWYIRLNRARFWVTEMTEDKQHAYGTLYTVLSELNQTMAPFTPFLADKLYQELKSFNNNDQPCSVHLCQFPMVNKALLNENLETAVARMQRIILLGRQKRNEVRVKTKYPLASLTVVHRNRELLNEIEKLASYVKAELNVKALYFSEAESDYIKLYAKPNARNLGRRLGKKFKHYQNLIETLDANEIEKLQSEGEISVEGETFCVEDILVFREARAGSNVVSDRYISIDLDCDLSDELVLEGLSREVVSRIQKTRRQIGLDVVDRIHMTYRASDRLWQAIAMHQDYIAKETLALSMAPENKEHDFTFNVDGESLNFTIQLVT